MASSGNASSLETKVLDYIKTYKAKGYSVEDIKSGLKKSGVDDATIKAGLAKAGLGGAASSSMLPIILGVLGVVFVLGLVIGGVVLFTGGPECESDSDCSSGYECSREVCVEEEDDDVQCTRDSDCGSGYECSRNQCEYVGAEEEEEEEEEVVEEELECESDDECEEGEECTDNECVEDSGAAEPQCGDGDCNIGEDCALDCGCTEDSECEVYGEYFCDEDTLVCEYTEDYDFDIPRPDLNITSIEVSSFNDTVVEFSIVTINDGEDDTDGTFVEESIFSYVNASGNYVNISEVNLTSSSLDYEESNNETMAHDTTPIFELFNDGEESVTVRLVAAVDTQNEIGEHSNDDNEETYEQDWNLTSFRGGDEEAASTADSCSDDSECSNGYACDTSSSECATSCYDTSGVDDDNYCADEYVCSSGECQAVVSDGPRCNDGVDNDGDGLIDYPYDRGCYGLYDDDERQACGDGIDNDNDGYIDMDDGGCTSPADHNERYNRPRCNDGKDNDGDGLKDIDDPGCSDKYDDDERDHGISISDLVDFIASAPSTFELQELRPLDKFKAFIENLKA